ncbi:MAG: HdeD family acid-resistance protein [Pseudomonadota bacterium]
MALPSQSDLEIVRDALKQHSGWLMAIGILWIVLGVLAILIPTVASIAVEYMIGVLLFIGGIAQLVQAWRAKAWSGFTFHALGAVFAILAGAYLILFPLRGVVSLTIVLAAFFVASGVLRGLTALNHREVKGWGWMAVSAVLSIVVGVMIWLELPGSAAWALGLLVGIEFLFVGMGLVMLAKSVR